MEDFYFLVLYAIQRLRCYCHQSLFTYRKERPEAGETNAPLQVDRPQKKNKGVSTGAAGTLPTPKKKSLASNKSKNMGSCQRKHKVVKGFINTGKPLLHGTTRKVTQIGLDTTKKVLSGPEP